MPMYETVAMEHSYEYSLNRTATESIYFQIWLDVNITHYLSLYMVIMVV
jgi:hypothetical protein